MYAPRKVLIVDDESSISDTLAKIFATSGYEARVAYTAEQADDISAEWLPDLAVIDVVLPGMNGIELALHLSARCPGCRLLLFSGDTRTADLLTDAATKGYSFDILAKPVHPTVILETAERLLGSTQAKKPQEPMA